jgi:hypothetical protein
MYGENQRRVAIDLDRTGQSVKCHGSKTKMKIQFPPQSLVASGAAEGG